MTNLSIKTIAGRLAKAACGAARGARALAVVLAFGMAGPAAADYNGWWWNPAQSGSGINVGHQGDFIFIAWFTYDETGKPMWLVMGGPMSGPDSMTGTFLRTQGPALGSAYDNSLVKAKSVGTGTISFADLHHATLAWNVDGKTGTTALVRQSYGTTDADGTYRAANGAVGKTTATAACAYAGTTFAVPASFAISSDASGLTISETQPLTAQYKGAVTQSGEWLQVASGTYTSTESYGGGTFTASLLALGGTVVVELSLSPSAHPGCVLSRTFTGAG